MLELFWNSYLFFGSYYPKNWNKSVPVGVIYVKSLLLVKRKFLTVQKIQYIYSLSEIFVWRI